MKLATLAIALLLLGASSMSAFAAGSSSSAEAAAASPADAAVVTATDPQTVLDALANLGYPGKLDKLESGRASIAVTISGLKTFVDFYDCKDDLTDCYTLLFNVALDLKDGTTPGKVNDWNSKQITGRVYLDDNSDPTLDFSVSTFEGVSASVFEQTVKLWDTKIGDFKDAFDF